MANNNQEIESKFYVRSLEVIEGRAQDLGADCIVPRGFEYNLRFDDAQNSLEREHKVLRLRKYDDIRLTFKGPGKQVGGALARTEIELVVNDFDAAEQFLEGLGYHIEVIYEKYRCMYLLGKNLITLDELPFGKFVEIEGETPEAIAALALQLGLNPAAAIPASYQGLFERVKKARKLNLQHLTFAALAGMKIGPEDMKIEPADEN
jgi:adenylate cyclase, class 2